jgi:DNA-binding NarL/FixJ family response regulator
MTALKSRVLLADDHALVRRGLRLILDAEPDLEVTAEAADGDEALRLASADEPDLAILDISMPRMTGLQAAKELHARRPRLPILILTMHESEQYLHEALRAGASAYVVKKVADRDLVEACRATLRGEPFRYPGDHTAGVGDALRRARDGEPPRQLLTPRETEIVKLVAESYTNKQIARALVISEKTVDRHRANILEKLGLHDRVDLVRYAIRNGLAEP